jgi:hypothetical protein
VMLFMFHKFTGTDSLVSRIHSSAVQVRQC